VSNFKDHLQDFEPVDLESEPAPVDTSFADQFVKVFTRMAKSQWKTQQKADLSARKIIKHLEERSDLLDDLKQRRAQIEDEKEQLERFILEVLDLISGFQRTAEASGDSEMQSTAATMQQALESSMEKIGLQKIPALGEVPDSMYHFVLDTRKAETEHEQNRIVEVIEPGYTLHGKVLRKANVIVAK